MKIGPSIKYHLERNGITQYKLAQRMVIGRSVVSGWCKDDANPTWESLTKIAKWLNVEVSEIIATAERLEVEEDDV